MGKTRVLELRIHGIANSPPAEILCTSNEKVQRKEGDEQGSFWEVKPTSELIEYLTPSGNMPSDVNVVTEAYSWGNQARSGGSTLVVIGRAIVHLGWLLVLPFGLCNLAYWARRDIKGTHEDQKWWAGGDGAALVRIFALLQTLFYTIGLVTVFVYLIGLQCFRPPGPDEGDDVRACAGLPGFMDFLADMTPVGRSALLGLMPVAVIFLIYLIGLRARGEYYPDRSFSDERMTPKEQQKLKKEQQQLEEEEQKLKREQQAGNGRRRFTLQPQVNQPPRPPLLSKGSFWLRTRTAQTSERTHLAAAFAFVLLLLSADALMDVTDKEPVQILADLRGASAQAPFPFWLTALGATLLLGAIVMVYATGLRGLSTGDRVKRGFATALLWVAGLAYGAWCVWAIFFATEAAGTGAPSERDLAGQIVVPTLLAAVGAIIAVASLTWGYPLLFKIVSWLFLAIGVAAVVWAEFWLKNDPENVDERRLASIGAMVAVGLAVGWSYTPLLWKDVRTTTRTIGWQGNGSAVALLIAWFSSLVITSLLVLGAHAWLTSDADDAAVDGYWRAVDGEPPAFPIMAPEFYERFAGSLVVILIVLILVVAAGAIAALRRHAAFSLPGLMYPRDLDEEAREEQQARDDYLGGALRLVDPKTYWPNRERPARSARRLALKHEDPMKNTLGRGNLMFKNTEIPWNEYPTSEIKSAGRARAIVDARRVAGLAHRGEPLMSILAILTAVALVPLAIPAIGEWLDTLLQPASAAGVPVSDPSAVGPWTALGSASGWALGLLALAAVAWVVTNAVTSAERPLGLVWDIIGFFPRAGHPFTPPCYSERAVPELKKRIRRFLKEERKQGNEPFVILSAHSMGATIAAATIFSLHDDEEALKRENKERAEAGEPVIDEDRLPPNPRVALLTHGVQLRAYFSRFFPEVFGPRVLGIRGTRGPALFRLDPWSKQVVDEAQEDDATVHIGEEADRLTLFRLLDGDFRPGTHPRSTPRWRNLWRRTDFLGFPVFNYWSHVEDDDQTNTNPIDRGATERSPRAYLWAVGRHNDYLSTAQYREARDELAHMLRDEQEGRTRSAPDLDRESDVAVI